jgi:hypothetical protein
VLVSLVSTAATRIAVVLPGVDGAVTVTVTSWLIESEVPELGTGLVTLTIVQAALLLVAERVKDVEYALVSL